MKNQSPRRAPKNSDAQPLKKNARAFPKGFPMPIPWLTVLQNVPWSEVVRNAPKVAEGAKKLWKAVAGKTSPALTPDDGKNLPTTPPDPHSIAALETRMAALEATSQELESQMLASSELITALAEQNAQLIERIDILRRRLRWLIAALLLSGGALLASSGWPLLR